MLAFAGALGGVALGNRLDRKGKRDDERRRRLEDAYRAVAVTVSRRNWSPGVEVTRATHLKLNIADLTARLSAEAAERYVASLHDAREKVALVTLDGVEVHDWWRTDEAMQEHLDDLLGELGARLRA